MRSRRDLLGVAEVALGGASLAARSERVPRETATSTEAGRSRAAREGRGAEQCGVVPGLASVRAFEMPGTHPCLPRETAERAGEGVVDE